MEKLFSNGIRRETVPDNYIFPVGKRPGKLASKCKAIPVIDLGGGAELPEGNRHAIIELILKAGKEFGFFQVLNHGIPLEVSSNMMGAAKEFFEMPMEDKAPYFSEDPKKIPRLFTGNENQTHGIKYWRDCLKVPCYPVEEFKHSWPEKPTEFRETLARYSVDARVLALRLLKLVSEGLGLKLDYFNGDLSGGRVIMNINYYAPCSDPTLTLGLPHHCDPNLITLLLQDDISGLEVFHEGEWIGVEPLENGMVVNIGHQLEIISNGMLKSVEHRAVTNSANSRLSIAMFIAPTNDCLIAPVPSMVDDHNPSLYRPFRYQEFLNTYIAQYR